ncbi:hypothetical protein Mapa_010411 [Marchantia paleacea]|nr:hypothetical protein Mapa_010411 [Marchantia paleacea]
MPEPENGKAGRQPGVDQSAQQSTPPTLDTDLLPLEYIYYSIPSQSEEFRCEKSDQTRNSAIPVECRRREGYTPTSAGNLLQLRYHDETQN